jgi:thiol:disulfide interchange protein DsbD
MEPGWHLYSLTTPRPPIATTITLADNASVSGLHVFQPKPQRKLDPNFGSETETFTGHTVFYLRFAVDPKAATGPMEVTAQVRYQACDEKQCLPPVRRTAASTLTVDPSAAAEQAVSMPAGYVEFTGSSAPSSAVPALPPPPQAPQRSIGGFVPVAFGFGLAAIFTPCVFPMIPITMSYFLKREAVSRRESILQAGVFAAGIVVLFCAMGLAVTALLGPFGVVQLGSNPWVNGFIAAVFFVFALSLLGAFEITLPSGLLTRLDRASQGGGYAGTLLMGLTFSLTSFACVGPFVGTLLAASVSAGGWQPLVGMAAFATGLASPFFFLALFPSLLARLPKSGGWLASVKVVLGFIILAAALKYLSNIDQVLQWNILTRERFLGAWIVLFTLAGLYLLGFLRMEGVNSDGKVGVSRLLVGAAFLVLAVSLIPGMFGARLGELDAYVPAPAATAGSSVSSGLGWLKNDYDAALTMARQENKLVLVAFTGYACTNCHWMKANMFTRPEVAAAMKDLVLVELYTDGTDNVSERNQAFQEKRFSTIAIPYYALMDANERVVATFAGLTRNTSEFLSFLKPPTT